MPLAYMAPTTLPALVPEMTAGVKPLASSILMTPMCANPLAAPPPRARPMRIGGAADDEAAAVCALPFGVGAVGLLAQAASRLIAPTEPRERKGRAYGRMSAKAVFKQGPKV
ncbi:hypothetical protein SDC9_104100 [bioreactor metagenome]|uniref:Uncharacterized protein n=1 Tax=bioreactor metagenome TaxID=1076179 RepID=A0A645AWX2_9ZZZZ